MGGRPGQAELLSLCRQLFGPQHQHGVVFVNRATVTQMSPE